VQSNRRARQKERKQSERPRRDEDRGDRELANLDTADRHDLVQLRHGDRGLADQVVVPEIDEERDRLQHEGDREGRDQHHGRRGRSQRAEDGSFHQQRERDDDGEAGDDADDHGLVGREGERVRAGHDQLAVGEVDQPQDAEHEADADGHQRIDRALADGVDEDLGVGRPVQRLTHEAR
jgi:hypothetical protein